jgi:hypothetical protein
MQIYFSFVKVVRIFTTGLQRVKFIYEDSQTEELQDELNAYVSFGTFFNFQRI